MTQFHLFLGAIAAQLTEADGTVCRLANVESQPAQMFAQLPIVRSERRRI